MSQYSKIHCLQSVRFPAGIIAHHFEIGHIRVLRHCGIYGYIRHAARLNRSALRNAQILPHITAVRLFPLSPPSGPVTASLIADHISSSVDGGIVPNTDRLFLRRLRCGRAAAILYHCSAPRCAIVLLPSSIQ